MFENEQTANTQLQQKEPQHYPDEQYPPGYDPYGYSMDPWMQTRPPANINAQVLLAVIDSKVKSGEDFEDYKSLLVLLVDNVGRIPSAEKTDIYKLNRDLMDILDLSECDGTKQMVLSRMTRMLFKMRSLASYGGAPLNGLTGVSAIITQRQNIEQQVKLPQSAPPEQPRKKIMGLF